MFNWGVNYWVVNSGGNLRAEMNLMVEWEVISEVDGVNSEVNMEDD